MSPKVLCIDDQVSGLHVRKIFLEASGYAVLTASTGREGLQMLKSQPVDAVVLDYRMPEMDGAQVACEIRKNHPELPIVLLSGYIAEIPPDLRGNVNRFVAKGSPPESLLVALEETIGSRPAKNLDAVASILDETQEQVARSRDHLGRASSHLSQSKKVIEKNVEHLQNLRRKKV